MLQIVSYLSFYSGSFRYKQCFVSKYGQLLTGLSHSMNINGMRTYSNCGHAVLAVVSCAKVIILKRNEQIVDCFDVLITDVM